MKATLKKIQQHIDEKYPDLGVQFYKGPGYFYFMGDTYETQNIESIYVPYLNCAPLEWWLDSVDSSIKEMMERFGE